MARAEAGSVVAKVRVYELAKEFGVESKAVMAKLGEMGEFVRSASSTIEAPVVRRLKEAFAGQAANAKTSAGQSHGRHAANGRAAAAAASPQAAGPQAASPQAASPQAAGPQAASPSAASPQAASPSAASPSAAPAAKVETPSVPPTAAQEARSVTESATETPARPAGPAGPEPSGDGGRAVTSGVPKVPFSQPEQA